MVKAYCQPGLQCRQRHGAALQPGRRAWLTGARRLLCRRQPHLVEQRRGQCRHAWPNTISDDVTLYNTSSNYVETRSWNGSSWIAVDRRIDGNVLFPGSMTANALAANSVTADAISAATLIVDTAFINDLRANVRNAAVLWQGTRRIRNYPAIDSLTLSEIINSFDSIEVFCLNNWDDRTNGLFGCRVSRIVTGSSGTVSSTAQLAGVSWGNSSSDAIKVRLRRSSNGRVLYMQG